MFHARVCLTSLRLSTLHSSQSLSSSTSSSLHPPNLPLHLLVGRFGVEPLCASANEESGPLVNNVPLTGYEPKFFDDYHISETTEIFIQESSSDTTPSNLHDSEISDYSIGRALSSALFTQEREEPAVRRQTYHSLEESLLSSRSLSVGHVRTGRLVHELSSLGSNVRENPCRDSENEQIRILFERQKEQILKHEFQADSDRRSIQELNAIVESQRSEINHARAGDEQLRRNQQLLHEQLLEQNRELHGISETTDIFIQESSGDNRSLNLHDLEFDDYTIGMALSSPLFTQERGFGLCSFGNSQYEWKWNDCRKGGIHRGQWGSSVCSTQIT